MNQSVCESDWESRDSLRDLRMCHPGWRVAGRITCPAARWEIWRDEIFRAVLLPAIDAAWVAAIDADTRAVIVVDNELNERLGPFSAKASRKAGAMLAAMHHPPPGERPWKRYAAAVDRGESPGHLVVMMAVRAAAFHLSPRAVASACLFLELHGGGRDEDVCRKAVGETLDAYLKMPALRAA